MARRVTPFAKRVIGGLIMVFSIPVIPAFLGYWIEFWLNKVGNYGNSYAGLYGLIIGTLISPLILILGISILRRGLREGKAISKN